MEDFNTGAKSAMPENGPAIKDFTKVVNSIYESSVQYFEGKAKESIITVPQSWNFEEEFTDLKDSLKKRISQLKSEQLDKLMKELKVRKKN